MNISTHTLPAPVRRGVLEVLPGFETAIWNRLRGGRTNLCWRGQSGTSSIVVKLFSQTHDNPLFPNDPRQESRMLRHLVGTGLAPELLAEFDTPLGRCIAYTHICGSLWSSGTFDVGTLLQRLHHSTPPTGLRRADTAPIALEEQSLTVSDRVHEFLPLLPSKPQPEQTPLALLHGDIVAGNLIRTSTGLSLIDWQAPALGDPCHDIAVFLSPAMMQLYRGAALDQIEIEEFFQGYGCEETYKRYLRLAPWLHLRMLAYCHWKAGQGEEDYNAAAQAELAAFKQSLANYPSQSLTV